MKPVRHNHDAAHTIALLTDRLAVAYSLPGSFYKGARFDWTGFVTQVTLDGVRTFCAAEYEDGRASGGIGLCNEFGLLTAVGYEEAAQGEQFPKLGVGLLTRKDDGPYRFGENYEIDPFPVKVMRTERAVEVMTEPLPCNGFEVRLTKHIAVSGTEIVLTYKLENTGTKRIVTEEYAHNFMRIGDTPVGPDYELRTPVRGGLSVAAGELIEAGAGIVRWPAAVEGTFYAAADEKSEGAYWRLSRSTGGASVSERLEQAEMTRFALWGQRHVVSPEIFVKVDVMPGETRSWLRRYSFD